MYHNEIMRVHRNIMTENMIYCIVFLNKILKVPAPLPALSSSRHNGTNKKLGAIKRDECTGMAAGKSRYIIHRETPVWFVASTAKLKAGWGPMWATCILNGRISGTLRPGAVADAGQCGHMR